MNAYNRTKTGRKKALYGRQRETKRGSVVGMEIDSLVHHRLSPRLILYEPYSTQAQSHER